MSEEESEKDTVVETIKFYFPMAVVHKHARQEYSILLPQVAGSKSPDVELTLTTRTNQWRTSVWNLSQNRFPAIEGVSLPNLLRRLPELAEASRAAALKQTRQARSLEKALSYNDLLKGEGKP